MAQMSLLGPVGPVSIEESGGRIVRIGWRKVAPKDATNPLLKEAASQVSAYFRGELRVFDLPLALEGTEFQKRVWSEMSQIPYGETRTYGELARQAKTAARAVGGACGANPIPIIVPCHRVVAANGGAGGYSGRGGLRTKTTLLDLENRTARLL